MTTSLPRPSRTRRVWRGFWLLVAIAAVLLHAVGGWLYSGKLVDETFVARGDRPGLDLPDEAPARLALREVTYDSPLGAMQAWVTDGSRSEWVIHIHGEETGPSEALQLMPALDVAGYHQMAITYRNDPGQPADPSGQYAFGRTEWADLAAAIDYARGEGATGIIVAGSSMGGSIAVSYAYREPDGIDALVLDAPILDLSAAIDHRAASDDLVFGLAPPFTLTATAKVFAALRNSINWSGLDYARRIGQLTIPTLIIHGTEDASVPVESSREVAATRGQFVTLWEVDGAGHGEAWNADPAAYERRVLDFIATTAG